jgi:hypothetical protein
VTRATDRFSSGSESRKARRQWLTPVILATREAEIRRITVRSQPGQIVCEILSRKTLHKNRVGGAAHGEGPEFKPQYRKKKKKNPEELTAGRTPKTHIDVTAPQWPFVILSFKVKLSSESTSPPVRVWTQVSVWG